MNNPFVHIAKGEFTMKKLHKKFEPKAFDLAAYYTCMCNHLPCGCNDYYDQGDTVPATNDVYDDIKDTEDASWN